MKLKTLRSSKGFTLIEIIFVLAIVAVLAGILVPLAISSLKDSETAKTRSDEDTLASSLTAFRKDVKRWPDNNSTTTTLNFAVEYLLVGTNAASGLIDTAQCPTDAATGKFFNTPACASHTAANNAFNHLATNNPNFDVTEGGTGDYSTTNWKGPYAAKLGPDTFGRAYVIYMKGIDKANTATGPTGTPRGWIISAGPDNAFQTQSTDTTISGDDIGFIFCTKCD